MLRFVVFGCWSEKGNLACLRHARKGAQGLELLNVGLRELAAAGGEFLNGDEILAPALLHGVLGRGFAQAVDGSEGREQAVSVIRNFAASDL